jgi:hypothetical protein
MINTGKVWEEFERKSTGMGLEINFNSTMDKKNATVKLSEAAASTP